MIVLSREMIFCLLYLYFDCNSIWLYSSETDNRMNVLVYMSFGAIFFAHSFLFLHACEWSSKIIRIIFWIEPKWICLFVWTALNLFVARVFGNAYINKRTFIVYRCRFTVCILFRFDYDISSPPLPHSISSCHSILTLLCYVWKRKTTCTKRKREAASERNVIVVCIYTVPLLYYIRILYALHYFRLVPFRHRLCNACLYVFVSLHRHLHTYANIQWNRLTPCNGTACIDRMFDKPTLELLYFISPRVYSIFSIMSVPVYVYLYNRFRFVLSVR